ncbi:MAG: hypothetical protein J5836_00245, partial [Clostridia bacterium]|nr:hypothetical protein [Clostridia bacterium]
MGKLNFSVHPLFFIFGLYFAATGKVFSFLVFTFSAVLHELGHAYAAEKLGYKLKKITLMPYGAVISGDIEGIKYTDELKVVLAGPLVNLAISIAILALWWIYPASYPYTELCFTANISIFSVNLIPAFPLDGGRFLLSTLSLKMKRRKAMKIAKISGYIFSLLLLGAFVYSIYSEINITILFFSLFILFGAVDLKKENVYMRVYGNFSVGSIKNFKEIKTIAVNEGCTVKKFLEIAEGESLYRVFVCDDKGGYKIIEPVELAKIISE